MSEKKRSSLSGCLTWAVAVAVVWLIVFGFNSCVDVSFEKETELTRPEITRAEAHAIIDRAFDLIEDAESTRFTLSAKNALRSPESASGLQRAQDTTAPPL